MGTGKHAQTRAFRVTGYSGIPDRMPSEQATGCSGMRSLEALLDRDVEAENFRPIDHGYNIGSELLRYW